MFRKALALGTATIVAATASVLLFSSQADARDVTYRATLRDPDDRVVGTVKFRVTHHAMEVDARLRPNDNVAPNQFHGFHIHANNNPSNGEGCEAEPEDAQSTWFVSADGHLSEGDQKHGEHKGDMPSPLVMADGTARLTFTTDRIDPADLKGTAVILHKDPDNFANVPLGPAPNQYSQNSDEATVFTDATGNAGPRMACGLVRRAWWGS
jgi:Cu-Zn family superoxide dismutase